MCKGFFIDLIGKGKTEKELSSLTLFLYLVISVERCVRDLTKVKLNLGAEKHAGGLDPLSQAAVDYVQAFNAAKMIFILKMMLEDGDIQVLNNRVSYHTRTEVVDHEDPSKKRLLYRVWLNAPQPRPMAPEFANQLKYRRSVVGLLKDSTYQYLTNSSIQRTLKNSILKITNVFLLEE